MAYANADEYAKANLDKFFQGYPNSLTGQCVSLIKWYIGAMAKVPNNQAARGHAKDYGDQLVREGLATKVSTPKRGDIAVWPLDGGGYGHIGVVLSNKRVFEENVNVGGARRGVFEGTVVYASRIDPLYADWRVGKPVFYRLKGYKETGGKVMITKMIANVIRRFYTGKDCTPEELKKYVGNVTPDEFRKIVMSWPSFDNDIERAKEGKLNPVDHLPATLRDVYKAPKPPTTTLNKTSVVKYVQDNLK